jgi:hypothetical protein
MGVGRNNLGTRLRFTSVLEMLTITSVKCIQLGRICSLL